jgi:hypothetical protein
MRTTYAIVWLERDGRLARGKLELLVSSVRLDGIVGNAPVTRELRYDELETVHVGRGRGERLNGQPTLVLTPHDGEPIRLASIAYAGALAELTERLSKTALAS